MEWSPGSRSFDPIRTGVADDRITPAADLQRDGAIAEGH
jgi:hypothetical protein